MRKRPPAAPGAKCKCGMRGIPCMIEMSNNERAFVGLFAHAGSNFWQVACAPGPVNELSFQSQAALIVITEGF